MIKKTGRQKRKAAKAKRKQKRTEDRPKPITSLISVNTSAAENRHEKETNDYPKAKETKSKKQRPKARKAYLMSGFVMVLFLAAFAVPLGIAIAAWQKGGYSNVRIALWWGIAAYVVLGIGLFFAYYYYVVKPAKALEKVATREPFSITRGTILTSQQRSLNTAAAWYSWYHSQLGDTVSPIHLMILIRITNRQAVRSQIETYRVEALTEDKRWVRLTWMDGQKGDVYYSHGNPKDATLWDLPKLDAVISERIIEPNETIEGWALFEFPESITSKQPLRVYVKDFGGAETTQEISGQPEGFAQDASIDIKPYGNRDLSSATLRYYSEVPR